jgi:hypothetical protein
MGWSGRGMPRLWAYLAVSWAGRVLDFPWGCAGLCLGWALTVPAVRWDGRELERLG